jgi:hypothetical protein
MLLWLAHVRIKVVEVSQFGGPESGIGVCGVEAFVVLDIDKDIVLACLFEQLLVVFEQLDGGLCDEDVDAALYGVEGNWVVGGVGGEDGDGAALWERIDGLLVGFGIAFALLGELVKGHVESVVGF